MARKIILEIPIADDLNEREIKDLVHNVLGEAHSNQQGEQHVQLDDIFDHRNNNVIGSFRIEDAIEPVTWKATVSLQLTIKLPEGNTNTQTQERIKTLFDSVPGISSIEINNLSRH